MHITNRFLRMNANGKSPMEAAAHWRAMADKFPEGSRPRAARMEMAAKYELLEEASIVANRGELITQSQRQVTRIEEAITRPDRAVTQERPLAAVARIEDASTTTNPINVTRHWTREDKRTDRAKGLVSSIAPRSKMKVTLGDAWKAYASADWEKHGWNMLGVVNDGRGSPGALVRAPNGGRYYKINAQHTVHGLDEAKIREAILQR